MGESLEDKRRFRRIGCRIGSWFKNGSDGAPIGSATIVSDISEGGVRFQTTEPLSPENDYYLFLEIPGRATIDSYVRPVWSWKNPHLNHYETGATFVRLHPEDQGAIRNLVASKL